MTILRLILVFSAVSMFIIFRAAVRMITVFEGRRNTLPWKVLITAFSPVAALNSFCVIIGEPNGRPNHVTVVVGVPSACAQVGDLDLGTWFYEVRKEHILHMKRHSCYSTPQTCTLSVGTYTGSKKTSIGWPEKMASPLVP